MFLYFHFSLCDVWVDSKGTMLADRLTKIEDAADAFGNHVICSSKAAVAAAVAVAALFGKKSPRFLSKEMLTVPDAEQAVDDLDTLEAPTCPTLAICSKIKIPKIPVMQST